MNEITKDFLDRLGPAGGWVGFAIVIIIGLWSMGLINAPATAHDVERIGARVGGVEERADSLEESEDLARDDLEKIRIEQAVQGERIENIDEKLDRVLNLLNRR